jgi:hypothetical protein
LSVFAPVVVPAVPPQPPQVTLVGSAVRPGDGSDPTTAFPDGSELALLPAELEAELRARAEGSNGPTWLRGVTYAPEQHSAGSTYDQRTGPSTQIDYAQLTPPQGLALAYVAGGTVPNETVSYQVTAVDANGETTPCTVVTLATGAIGSVKLSWISVAYFATYKVYGRVGGSIGLLHTISTSTPGGETVTWTDDGSATPGAAPPASNTTAGSGVYTNLAIRTFIPYPLSVMDTCSAFGWEERDYKGRASRWAENAQYAVLEAEFWSGALAQAAGYPNDYLANNATCTDLTPGTVPSIARGFQILQDALAQAGFGGRGMIHVMPQTTPNLLTTRRVGNLLLDQFDNIVVPGVGYTGTGPGGVVPAAGFSWMYATDLVQVRLEKESQIYPDTFAEALDRGQAGFPNTITFRAQKMGAAYWDGFAHYACKVQLAT